MMVIPDWEWAPWYADWQALCEMSILLADLVYVTRKGGSGRNHAGIRGLAFLTVRKTLRPILQNMVAANCGTLRRHRVM